MKSLKIFIALILSISVLANVVSFAETEDITKIAVADTFSNSVYPQKNYSLDKELVVSKEEDCLKDAYISFNVGLLPSNVSRVLLKLTTVSALYERSDETENEDELTRVTVIGLASHEWKQGELTYTSAPKTSSEVASFLPESTGLVEVDVTEYVKSNISYRGYISFKLSVGGDKDAEFRFASIESVTAAPQLLIQCNDFVEHKVTDIPKEETESDDLQNEAEKEVTEPARIESWDMSYLPDDLYIEEFTSRPFNHYMTSWLPANRSTFDNGNLGFDAAQLINGLAISPTNPNKILLASNCHGVYRSEDGGKTTYQSMEGMNANHISQIAFYPDDDNIVFCATLGGGPPTYHPSKGLFKSTDSGKTWRRVCGEVGFTNSRAWRLISFGDKNSSGIRPVYVAGNIANRTGLWKSEDLGETWTQILSDKVCHQIDVRGDRIVVACAEDGVFISSDAGKTWVNSDNGIEKENITGITVDPNNASHIICLSANKVYETIDQGETWSVICDNNEIGLNLLKQIMYGPLNKDGHARLYICGRQNEYPIRYSDDNGTTWNIPESPGSGWWDCYIAFSELYPEYVYASIQGLMLSTDGGTTFKSLGLYGRTGEYSNVFLFDEKNPSNILQGGFDYGVRISVPRADEWFPATTVEPMTREGVQALTVFGLARDPSNPDRILYASSPASSQGTNGVKKLFESLDGGWNFKRINEDILFDSAPILFSQQDSKIIYNGSHKSYDGGKTWEKLPMKVCAMSNLNHNIVYSNQFSGSKLDFVYISEDGGYTWEPYTENQYKATRFAIVDADDPYKIYIPTRGAVVIKDKDEERVVNHTNGLKTLADGTAILFTSVAQNPRNHDHIVTGGRDSKNKQSSEYIFESFDRGVTWRAIPIPPPGDVSCVAFHPTRPLIYIGIEAGTVVYNYENYDKVRPDSHFYDTEGTFCEEAVNYLWDVGYVTEASNLEYGIDKYQLEGDFLDWILQKEELVASRDESYFDDISRVNRYYWTIQSGMENGLILPSDGENGNLNLLYKKLTHGMCAKYLVRLLKVKGFSIKATTADISRFIDKGMAPDVAYAVAVLSNYKILSDYDVFEFSSEKVATRGEIAVMLSRTLKLFK